MDKKLILSFYFTSLFVSIVILFILNDQTTLLLLLKNLLLSTYFALSLWLLVDKFNNFGLALLSSFSLLFIISIFNSIWVLIISILLFSLLFVRNLFYSKNTFISFTMSDIIFLPSLSLILSLISFTAMGSGYCDLWINQKVLLGYLHQDTWFHCSVANMINNYNVISTGLNGLPAFGYHILSHLLYVNISNILNTPVYQIYGFTTFIVFIPLLFFSCMSITEEIFPSRNKLAFYISFLLLISTFIGFLGRNIFIKFGLLWDSYFISESYLISIIMLFSLLSYCFSKKKGTNNIFVCSLFLFFITMSKVSTGLMGYIIIVIFELFFENNDRKIKLELNFFKDLFGLLKKITIKNVIKILFYTILYYYIAGFISNGNGNSQYKLNFLFYPKLHLKYLIYKYNELGVLIIFCIVHYFYVILAILLTFIYSSYKLASLQNIRKLILILLPITIIGFLTLSIENIPGYYFSSVSMFIAIPILLSSKNFISVPKIKKRLISIFCIFVLIFGLLGCITYGIPYIEESILKITRIKKTLPCYSKITPYIKQLEEIAKLKKNSKYLIYIPKKEKDFWRNSTSLKIPFIIPAVSGHPALFGLPEYPQKKLEMLNNYYDYGNYDIKSYNIANKPAVTEAQLCKETRKLGFNGYFLVSSHSYEKIKCSN